jgi:hypothetical protein
MSYTELTCKSWGSHSGVAEDSSLLRCDAVSLGEEFQKDRSAFIFRLKQPSWTRLLDPEYLCTTVLGNVGKSNPNDTASHPRRIDCSIHQLFTKH